MRKMSMQQGGMSALGFIIILLMIAFFTMIVLKLMPVYFENFKVNSALRSLKEEPGINDKTSAEIENIILRRFRIDNIERVNQDHIKIKRDRSGIIIDLNYEIRNNFIGNIDVVVSFDDTIEVTGH